MHKHRQARKGLADFNERMHESTRKDGAWLQALADFNARILEYEKVYEPLTDGHSNRHIHFIQLVNMVTGRGYMDINRISGYIPGKIVSFLMQVCPHARCALAHFLGSAALTPADTQENVCKCSKVV